MKITIKAVECIKHLGRCEYCVFGHLNKSECEIIVEQLECLGLPDCDNGYYYTNEESE